MFLDKVATKYQIVACVEPTERSVWMQKVEAKYELWDKLKATVSKIWNADTFKKAIAALVLSLIASNAMAAPAGFDDSGLSKDELKQYQAKEPAGQIGHKFMAAVNKTFADGKLPITVKADMVKKGNLYVGNITVKNTEKENAASVVIQFHCVGGKSSGAYELKVGETQGYDDYTTRAAAEIIGNGIAKKCGGIEYKAPWGKTLNK